MIHSLDGTKNNSFGTAGLENQEGYFDWVQCLWHSWALKEAKVEDGVDAESSRTMQQSEQNLILVQGVQQ